MLKVFMNINLLDRQYVVHTGLDIVTQARLVSHRTKAKLQHVIYSSKTTM